MGVGRGIAYSMGAMLGAGMASGLASQVGAVRAQAAALASAAEAAIRAKAQIHSPSRVTDSLGSYWGKGFANGIKGQIRNVWNVSKKLVSIPSVRMPAQSYGVNDELEYAYGDPLTIEVPVTLDGKTIAKVTAPYTKSELNKLNIRQRRRMGYA